MNWDGRHHNKLSKCFDDIMTAAAEMMVQQQIKSIQLSSDIAPGFTQSQHKLLGEKVHAFHSVLDDLDLTLTAARNSVDSLAAEALEREQKLREQQRLQEKEDQKMKEQEEERKRLEEARKSSEQAPASGGDYAESTPATFLNEISKTGLAASKSNIKVDASGTTASDNGNSNIGGNAGDNGSGSNGNFSSGFNDLNDLDLSMFGGVEESDIGLGNFDDTQLAPPQDKNPGNQMAYSSTMTPSNGRDPNDMLSDEAGGNPDSYLTLNDFNDLGLDWNTSEGHNGLEMDEFNI
ncbi:LADA_0F06326g1_1 [Lachancea dasiensis]|uniref:LADA_0F06326g1_1 n=1 Tax=Lachancea dasiensis TaxID=1072105 RepID=A0A1G4JJU7_9SACH|nr:LADA_0F06326g1_1 [Lachancea dasiensis]